MHNSHNLTPAAVALVALSSLAFGQSYPRTGFSAPLSTVAHNVSGRVHIVDSDTVRVEQFNYDGGGISVYFYLGTSNTGAAFANGLRIGPQLFGTPYSNATLVIDLPLGTNLNGYNAASVWCDAAGVSFGSGTFAQTAPVTYCTAKINSLGCTPGITTAGSASATNLAPFTIGAASVINQSPGLMVYSYATADIPFQGGTLCIGNPIRRTPVMFSGGGTGTPSCTGSYAMDFNAFVRAGGDVALEPGREVCAQYYYRDVGASFGVGLTNAVRFFIAP